MRNSQGIDSRVTREQVKAQRLQNAMMADQLARPTQDIQDFGNMQNIFAQQMQGMNQALMDPLKRDQMRLQNQSQEELQPLKMEQLGLQNQALEQSGVMEALMNPLRQEQLRLANQENESMSPLRQEQMQLQNFAQQRMNDTPQPDQDRVLNMQLLSQLIPQLSQQADTTGFGQELMRMLGLESTLGPKSNPYAIQETPEELAMKEKLMSAIQSLQQQ